MARLEPPVWEQICTAPRDGRLVLGWSEDSRKYYVVSFDGTPPAGWVAEDAEYAILDEAQLTHWAALPDPPQGQRSRGAFRTLRGVRATAFYLAACLTLTLLGILIEDGLNLIP